MAHVSHKLSNSFEGALAGGGDPATSPLYVFGPFLRLIVVAGVAQITFGASVWLVVLTIAVVSAMYRLVMNWVTDGSGGSGLSEEEFGGWAVKINAGITFVEYTLTFLVSMAALVTFVADRFPILNESLLGIQYRTIVAIILSVATGWLVNRGPKVSARAFGPATAAVLLLLWIMIFATIWQLGFQLPTLDLRAFSPENFEYTIGGYVRILAVMTGIEVFANLVAAYDGKRAEKSRKAFGSLIIIMGTTSLTMLIVGPAILELSDPTNTSVSVFTQTMDQLLPSPLPYLGTLIGVAVLLSASAASAQGLQNLALGLKYRHYVPEFIGRRNRFEVADYPVWIQVTIVAFCFLAFGTHEETYLAIYAAGVFVLLSMTGWAVSKRLIRELRISFSGLRLLVLIGTILAATLTSCATIIIFAERFREGAWTYFLFIPALYVLFTYFRRRLGTPTAVEEMLGRMVAERKYVPALQKQLQDSPAPAFQNILVPLDGSEFAEKAMWLARPLVNPTHSRLRLLTVTDAGKSSRAGVPHEVARDSQEQLDWHSYLTNMVGILGAEGLRAEYDILSGTVSQEISHHADSNGMDLIVMSTHGRTGVPRLFLGSVAANVVQQSRVPVLLVRPTRLTTNVSFGFQNLLLTLDGSELAEEILPYARALAQRFGSKLTLLSVPEGEVGEKGTQSIIRYLERVAAALAEDGFVAEPIITGFEPAQTIVQVCQDRDADLIMMATHGRSGMQRILLGSVADRVVQHAQCPVFLVPRHQH